MRQLPEDILFDSRLVERHIRQGLTTREGYDAWLAKQPDVADRAEFINVESLQRGDDLSSLESDLNGGR